MTKAKSAAKQKKSTSRKEPAKVTAATPLCEPDSEKGRLFAQLAILKRGLAAIVAEMEEIKL